MVLGGGALAGEWAPGPCRPALPPPATCSGGVLPASWDCLEDSDAPHFLQQWQRAVLLTPDPVQRSGGCTAGGGSAVGRPSAPWVLEGGSGWGLQVGSCTPPLARRACRPCPRGRPGPQSSPRSGCGSGNGTATGLVFPSVMRRHSPVGHPLGPAACPCPPAPSWHTCPFPCLRIAPLLGDQPWCLWPWLPRPPGQCLCHRIYPVLS